MSTECTVRVAGPVVRAIHQDLPEAVAGATIESFNGALRENPRGVGHALRNDLEGPWGARRGSFRVICAIDDASHIVSVIRVDPRRGVAR